MCECRVIYTTAVEFNNEVSSFAGTKPLSLPSCARCLLRLARSIDINQKVVREWGICTYRICDETRWKMSGNKTRQCSYNGSSAGLYRQLTYWLTLLLLSSNTIAMRFDGRIAVRTFVWFRADDRAETCRLRIRRRSSPFTEAVSPRSDLSFTESHPPWEN